MAKKTPVQALFAQKIAKLILFIESEGFHVTFGDAFASSGHTENSHHYKKLAIDSICAVGDEDQSIYSWRGAQVANMLHFQKDYNP